jgi:AraC-like DNA-binding protein
MARNVYEPDHQIDDLFRVGAFSHLQQVLTELGCQLEEVVKHAGLSMPDLSDPEQRLRIEDGFRLLASCATRTARRDFGLLLGEAFTPRDLGVLGDLAVTAPTLGDALACLVDNVDLQDDGSIVVSHIDGNFCSLFYCMHSTSIAMPSIVFDYSTAMCCKVIRAVCGRDWNPIAVYLQTRKPRDRSTYERFFRCPIYFDSPYCELVFRTSDLTRENPSAEPLRHSALNSEAIESRRQMFAEYPLQHTLPRTIRRGLLNGAFRASDVALSVGIHERTLHRRLARLGTNYREQLDVSRKAFAAQLLIDTRLPMFEVAMALGYSDSPAFIRAFHRWHGDSPRHWQERLEGTMNTMRPTLTTQSA